MVSSLLALGLTLSTLTAATPTRPLVEKNAVRTPMLRAGVTARHAGPQHRRVRRQQAYEAETYNELNGFVYTIDVEIGTPPQTVSVHLDTGSPELWVNPTCENSLDVDFCEEQPRFNQTESSSFKAAGVYTNLRYGTGNTTIEYARDVVAIGSMSINSQIFGVTKVSYNHYIGILGLSPPVQGEKNATYTYVLDNLVDQGVLDSRAFSLDLRDVDSSEGSIIFGGIDTGKYIGSLEKLPIQSPRGGGDRYWVNLSGAGLTLPNGESVLVEGGDSPVILDSGSTISTLPTVFFEGIGAALGGKYDDLSGNFVVDCGLRNVSGTVDFVFGEKVIGVSYKDFIITSNSGACILGMEAGDDMPILGDTVLRAAYAVFDQDNRNVHLAQAANCGENLVAISSGVDAVPSVTGDCPATTPTPVLTGSLKAPFVTSTVTAGGQASRVSASGLGPKATASGTATGRASY